MKKILIIFTIIFLSNNVLNSHDQETNPVHQRIVVEAYKLLKLQFSKELWIKSGNQVTGFADMDSYIGDAI